MPQLFEWLDAHVYVWPAFIIVARLFDVSFGTMRTIAVVRGHRGLAMALGVGEVGVWLVAVSGVLTNLTLLKAVSYCIGFSLGNACGMWLEEKLAIGHQVLTFISQDRTHDVSFALRLANFTVTQVPARGGQGRVAMCLAVIPRRRSDEAMRVALAVDSDVFVTVEDCRQTTLSEGPATAPATGWRALLKKK
jgi:uncharacterized protein YebE (UPF0316 family)